MSQAVKKIGVFDKSLVMSINDSWETAHGEITDLHDINTGELQNW